MFKGIINNCSTFIGTSEISTFPETLFEMFLLSEDQLETRQEPNLTNYEVVSEG